MNVYVCVGSSCPLKGSYHIIHLMKEHMKKSGLADKVNLSASFCLGKCTDGVTIQVDDQIVCGVSSENFSDVFNKYILKGAEEDGNE